jgi:type IV pilus assembly protein PilX
MGQRGAALIVGLIMLLLLTLIGVAGMRDTLLQQKMIANTKDREIALQAAESALLAAGKSLTGILKVNMTNSAGLYDLSTASPSLLERTGTEAAFWNNWGSGSWNSGNSVAYNRALTGVVASEPPRYVVEKLPLDGFGAAGGSGGSGSATSGMVTAGDVVGEPAIVAGGGYEATVYRVTVRAVGSSSDAVVLLQGIVRRVDPK